MQDDRATGAVLRVTAHGFQERLAKDAPVLAANVSKHFCVELYELPRINYNQLWFRVSKSVGGASGAWPKRTPA